MVTRRRIFKQLLKNPSFRHLEPDAGPDSGGISGQAFLVTDGSSRHKLRECDSCRKAKELEQRLKKVTQLGILPKFHGRDGRYLLFDFIEGRDLVKQEGPAVIHKLGQMVGKLNKVKVNKYDHNKYFLGSLDYLLKNDTIDKQLYDDILAGYRTLGSKIKLQYCMDYKDMQPSNVRMSTDGKLYFIDEEAMRQRFKGFGLAKPFMKWFDEAQRAAFENGYNTVSDIGFFDADLEKFSGLYYLVVNTRVKHEGKRPHQKNLARLKKLLDS